MNMNEGLPVFSVSEINRYIKGGLDRDPLLQSVTVSGEISNFKRQYPSGHLYFTLKDELSQLKSVMFCREAQKLLFNPENGMKVLVGGRITAYERDGVYQLYVNSMQPDGAGALALAFEQLKKKLAAEGLFDERRKKRLPEFPRRIGVITSATGAAVQDILSITARRYPLAAIVLEPVAVQGEKAAWELKCAVEKFTSTAATNGVDVIIIGRGGGSVEDLWCFNDELLARAIAACPIPVVSAVGHETDFTICDFVSDVRAATPSAAAELVTPDINDLKYACAETSRRLYSAYEKGVRLRREKLADILSRRNFYDPGHFFDSEKNAVAAANEKLGAMSRNLITVNRARCDGLTGRLSALNPLSVLLRGYSAVEKEGKILSDTKKIKVGDALKIKMSDGELDCEVKEICRKN